MDHLLIPKLLCISFYLFLLPSMVKILSYFYFIPHFLIILNWLYLYLTVHIYLFLPSIGYRFYFILITVKSLFKFHSMNIPIW